MRKVLFLLLIFSSYQCFAQLTPDTVFRKYPFVHSEVNHLTNDSIGLLHFYSKMSMLSEGKLSRVNVVHIGDSHIQADQMSGVVRVNLQKEFGNAGRGFVFPQRVARSNESSSVQSWTNVKWRSRRNVMNNDSLPIGLGGFTIVTTDTNALLKVKLADQDGLDYRFKKLTLFHDKGYGNFDLSVCDNFNCVLATITSQDTSEPFISTVRFNNEMNEFILKPFVRDTIGKHVQLYGMSFENDKPGVLYNTIGVNGAEYRHYNSSVYFNDQLKQLQPDLIIISLGTNEAFARNFEPSIFINQVDTLIQNLKKNNPGADFLVTIPGDHLLRRKYKNLNLVVLQQALTVYCLKNNIAFWDLLTIMGGPGSMSKWYLAKLTAKDKIHMNRKGYELQGKLLSSALLNGLARYKAIRP